MTDNPDPTNNGKTDTTNTGEKIPLDGETLQELKEVKTEDPILTEYGSQGSDENPFTELAEKWFPNRDDWQGKTRISPPQAHALSLARAMTIVYPEIEELNPFLMSMIINYEQYQTSIEGLSREQQVSVLKSMFGDATEVGEENRSMIMGMLNGNVGDDND